MNALQKRWATIEALFQGAKGLGGVSVSSLEMGFYCGAVTMGRFALSDPPKVMVEATITRTVRTSLTAGVHAMREPGTEGVLPREFSDPNPVDEGWSMLLRNLDNPTNKAPEKGVDLMRFAFYNGAHFMVEVILCEDVATDEDAANLVDYASARVAGINERNKVIKEGGVYGNA